MIEFELIEVVTASVCLVLFLPSFLIYPGAVIYRQYALLRDVKPLYCLLCHAASFIFTAHLMLGWKHQDALRILLEVFALLGNVFFFGFFVCKHYVLCQRYETGSGGNSMPPYVAFLLASFPYVIIATYRVAANGHFDYSLLATGLVVLVQLMVVRVKFFVLYHPSPHFLGASRLELVTILYIALTTIVHQFTSLDPLMVVLIIGTAILVNASFLAYTAPPLYHRFRRRDEYNIHSHFRGDVGRLNYSRETSLMRGTPSDDSLVFANNSLTGPASPTDNNWFAKIACKLIGPKMGNNCNSCNTSVAGSSSGTPGTTSSTQHSMATTAVYQSEASHTQAAANKPLSPELKAVLELINDGDSKRLQTYLARTRLAVINECDHRGRTPLHHAVARGDIATIRFLLQMGADRNQVDHMGYAPLHDAVRINPNHRRAFTDQSNVISELLEGGARAAVVNLATQAGLTPLHYAIMRDALGTLHTLLRYDANPMHNHEKEDPDIHWQEVHSGSTANFDSCRRSPITLAVEMGYERHVSSLIQSMRTGSRKAFHTFDTRCAHGLTLLHIALSLGHAKVTDVLLREGRCSPLTTQCTLKQNAFHFAALGGSCEALCYVIDAMDLPDVVPKGLRTDVASPLARGNGSGPSTPVAGSSAAFPLMVVGSARSARGSAMGSSMALFPRSMSFGEGDGSGHSGGRARSESVHKHMTYGEALGTIQRHIPGFILDSNRLHQIEGRVDGAVAEAKSKGHPGEASRLQHAMVVLTRRCKSFRPESGPGSSSLPASQRSPSEGGHGGGSQQFCGSTTSVQPGMPDPQYAKALEMLNQADSSGMLPLHYAIRNGNCRMCTIFTALGASVLDGEDPTSSDLTLGSNTAHSNSNSSPGGQSLFTQGSAGSQQMIHSSNLFQEPLLRNKSNSSTVSGGQPVVLHPEGSGSSQSPTNREATDLFSDFSAATNNSTQGFLKDQSSALLSEDSQTSRGLFAFASTEHGEGSDLSQDIIDALKDGRSIAREYLAAEAASNQRHHLSASTPTTLTTGGSGGGLGPQFPTPILGSGTPPASVAFGLGMALPPPMETATIDVIPPRAKSVHSGSSASGTTGGSAQSFVSTSTISNSALKKPGSRSASQSPPRVMLQDGSTTRATQLPPSGTQLLAKASSSSPSPDKAAAGSGGGDDEPSSPTTPPSN